MALAMESSNDHCVIYFSIRLLSKKRVVTELPGWILVSRGATVCPFELELQAAKRMDNDKRAMNKRMYRNWGLVIGFPE